MGRILVYLQLSTHLPAVDKMEAHTTDIVVSSVILVDEQKIVQAYGDKFDCRRSWL